MSPTIDQMDKVEAITNAWKLNAPNATFAGMTFQDFIQAIAPFLKVRQDLIELTTRVATLKAQRAAAEKSASVILDRVVAGVRADVEHGPDSPLWAAMGFVRKSARKRRLTRKSKPTAVAATLTQQAVEPREEQA